MFWFVLLGANIYKNTYSWCEKSKKNIDPFLSSWLDCQKNIPKFMYGFLLLLEKLKASKRCF
jgi:hypothetical protein